MVYLRDKGPIWGQVHSGFSEHDIGEGHSTKLDIFSGEDACTTGLHVSIKNDVGFLTQGALHMFSLKAQIAFHNDMHLREDQLLLKCGGVKTRRAHKERSTLAKQRDRDCA